MVEGRLTIPPENQFLPFWGKAEILRYAQDDKKKGGDSSG
jgi:hypothetical protein